MNLAFFAGRLSKVYINSSLNCRRLVRKRALQVKKLTFYVNLFVLDVFSSLQGAEEMSELYCILNSC